MSRLSLALISTALVLILALCMAYLSRHWLLKKLSTETLDPVLSAILGVRIERNVMIAMRDGVHLATDLFIPTRRTPPFPAVLTRTPYNKDGYNGLSFARKGYVVVNQDMRGRFRSQGTFAPYPHEGADGADTVNWLARQPWSNGKVGTIGCSALGESQVLLARERNPHHVAMIAMGAGGAIGSAGGRYGYFGLFEGGVFNLASGFGWFLHNGGKTPGARLEQPVDVGKALWGLPVAALVRTYRSDPTDFDDFVSRPLTDPYWQQLGYIGDDDRFSTPALLVNTWQDQTVADTLILAERMKTNADSAHARTHTHVLIGPGNHCDLEGAAKAGTVGDLPLGRNAAQPYQDWYMQWFDYWLHGKSDYKPDFPSYRFYILGEDRWSDTASWPPAGVTFTRWFLGGPRPANSVNGGGTLQRESPIRAGRFDEFRYDPASPVPTRGGPVCCTGNPADRSGPVDQRDIELRDDVLVYTSAPLRSGLRIAGPLSADLHLSSSAPDTDFVVKLVDVRPDGAALNIQEGALRMRYRDGFRNPKPMRTGEVYRVQIDMRAIAYYLPPGHRLRVQVTSSNFPRLERNLNTGGNNYDEMVGIVARNRVLTDPDHASAIVIPEWPEVPTGQLSPRGAMRAN